MDAAMHMLLHPRATKPIAHAPGDSAETYLRKCKQNIEAEVWSLVCNSRQAVDVATGDCVIQSIFKAGVRLPCDQLRHNLLVIKGYLCLATRVRADGAVAYERGCAFRRSGTFLVGYVKPYMSEYAAVVGFLLGGVASVPSILKDIALLGTARTPYAFDKRPFSDSVASNALQRQSVLGLAHTVEGIQGPPGTGKSSTIFHIVNSAMPVGVVAIITCVQNRAVDALACKFQCSAVNTFLVLGSPDRLGDTAKRFALETRVEAVAAVVLQRGVFEWTARVLDFLHAARRKREASRQFKSVGWRRWWVLYSRIPLLMVDLEHWSARYEAEEHALAEVRLAASQALASEAVVVLCTVDALYRVNKLHHHDDSTPRRRILIIDEAGTVPEYKIPLAVSLGVEAVIAVGDQNQLPPFTHTGMANGFFHRLARTVPPSMLEEQFRMHPDISRFVSSSFYQDRLFTNPAIASTRCSVPSPSGVHWMDYADSHAETSKGGALCNQVELGMLRRFMTEYHLESQLDNNNNQKTVMIITFYREQFHLLMLLGEKLGLVGTRLCGTKTERFFVYPNFRISTVDAAQGSESDVVVLSCVRSNPRHDIGFLAHPNRTCVALSRARERLIVVGHSKTLTAKSAMWRALYETSSTKTLLLL